MLSRRDFLQSTAAIGMVAGAGCTGLLGDCSPPDEDPPETTFRLEFVEERDDGRLQYDVVHEGPATFTETNTGMLEVWEYQDGERRGVYSWFDPTVEVPEGENPAAYQGASPVEPGDTAFSLQSPDAGWMPIRVLWGPPSVEPMAKECRTRTLAEWTEPPAEGPDF